MVIAIGLYIHIPFCVRKCFYCDFVSYPASWFEQQEYLTALKKEVNLYGLALAQPEKEVSSLFIGGGTPTLLDPAGLVLLLESVKSSFSLLPGLEITVEANPCTVKKEGLRLLAEAGVNRLSIGVQSFHVNHLEVLGRIHSPGDAAAAVEAARGAGFANINLDLIFGIPGQTMSEWLDTLRQAVGLGPKHLALYGLQLEKGTILEQSVVRGERQPCREEDELAMFQEAICFLDSRGYEHYEISNFARPGMKCAHNLTYWMNLPYLGLGAGAHSYMRGVRFSNYTSLKEYSRKLLLGECPVEDREKVSFKTEISETMFLGLRLIKGLDLELFYRRFGRKVEDFYFREINSLVEEGLIEYSEGCLRLTSKGLPVANRVFREFI